MTVLIACLLTGKGSWGTVSKLMDQAPWERIILVTNQFGKEKFTHTKSFETLLIGSEDTIVSLITTIQSSLGRIPDTEVALNLTSGTGVEHMAVLAAILRSGLGVRLVIPGESTFQEL